MRLRTITRLRHDLSGAPPQRVSDSATWIGSFMLRYLAHITGQAVYGDKEWREFMRDEAKKAADTSGAS